MSCTSITHAACIGTCERAKRRARLVGDPEGIPTDPKRNPPRRARRGPPAQYIDFAGQIPEGEYGAGKVEIWDGGHETHKFREGEVMVTFHGERLGASSSCSRRRARTG